MLFFLTDLTFILFSALASALGNSIIDILSNDLIFNA